jgi:hypothetical protein
MNQLRRLAAVMLLLVCAAAAQVDSGPSQAPKHRKSTAAATHKMSHRADRPLSEREKQQRAILKKQQKQQAKLAKSQLKQARRNTRRVRQSH